MAGDWIKMRNDLSEDPAVIEIAAKLGLDEFAVVGRLQCLWAWADGQSRDGHARGVTSAWIDRKVQRDGFAQAMCDVRWLAVDAVGVTFPNFDHHNGETAKTRALAGNRKKKQRAGAAAVTPEGVDESRNERDKGVTREEKRREEVTTSLRSVESASRATRKCPADFEISIELQNWAHAEAPGVDLRRETDKFRDHTFKTAHSDWPGAWRNWIRRSAESRTPSRAPQGRHNAAAAAIFDMDPQGAVNV